MRASKMRAIALDVSIARIRPGAIGLLAATLCLRLGSAGANTLADSVADWLAAAANDGVVSQGEFGWEYGYISNFMGSGGIFYGWHTDPFYWESGNGVAILWPPGQATPDIVWGHGGDSTGCRAPMLWSDGAYPWAGGAADKWSAVRRWTGGYSGLVDISGSFSRYFDPNLVSGWDAVFSVAVNADWPWSAAVYSQYIPWNDNKVYNYLIHNLPIQAGDTINIIVSPPSTNAANTHIRTTATITQVAGLPGDLDASGCVNFRDFAVFAARWGQTDSDCPPGSHCEGADQDWSGAVNAWDLHILAYQWLGCAGPLSPAHLSENRTLPSDRPSEALQASKGVIKP